MNNIFKKSLKGGLLGLMAMVGFSGCTDDHFDIFGAEGSNGKTIWQNIQEKDDLNDFKQILSRCYMMRSETDKIDPKTTRTMADLLNESLSFTVWAPTDGSYNAQRYLDLLSEAEKEYEENGVSTTYQHLMYQVGSQFINNHVARFSYEGSIEEQQVILLNGKKVRYNPGALTFNGVSLGAEPTIFSSNGALHMLNGISPFAYNVYDIIRTGEQFGKLRNYLLDPLYDHYTFNEYGSVAGALNEDGNMVYVDSVFTHTNDILDYCGARLQNEDSVYVTILPTDKAWDAAVAKLSKYFHYKDTIRYNFSSSTGEFLETNAGRYVINADSLTKARVERALVQSAFFSPSIRKEITDIKDSVSVIETALMADSLISTNNCIFYNSKKGEENPMFNGMSPIRASNGYVFDLDEYNVLPEYVWMQKQEISNSVYYKGINDPTYFSLNESNRLADSLVVDPYDIKGYNFYKRKGRGQMFVDFPLRNLLSGSYTIKAIMIPNGYCTGAAVAFPEKNNRFYCQVVDDGVSTENSSFLEIAEGYLADDPNTPEPDDADKTKSQYIQVEQDSIQTYTLIERIDIPYCVQDVKVNNDTKDTFFRLRFLCEYGDGAGLSIYRIIVEPYRKDK